MWLCTQHGFYSIVEKAPDVFHVRARVRADLENLVARLKKKAIKIGEIEEWPRADYRYRILTNKLGVQAVMIVLADTLDYSNFKSRVDQRIDQRDKLRAYQALWADGQKWDEKNTVEGRANTLISTSVDDLRSTLKCNEGKMDPNVLVAALHLARDQGYGSKSRLLQSAVNKLPMRVCRKCRCTEEDCSGCIQRTGRPCSWVEWDLCSACVTQA